MRKLGEVLNEGEQWQQRTKNWEEEIIEQEVEVPTYHEFQNVIRTLKKTKGLVRTGGQELQQSLYELVAEIWNPETMLRAVGNYTIASN